MTLIRGGPAGPDTEDVDGYQNLVEDDRAAYWQALGGRQGIVKGFDHSLPSGVLGHDFTAGHGLVEERDAAGALGLGRGYHLYEDVAFQVVHETPDADSRNDAVVFAYVDTEDGAIGGSVSQSGPQVVIIKGTSGVTTPHTDGDITTALGRGGWFRYMDVIIDSTDTEVNPANITFNETITARRNQVALTRTTDQAIAFDTITSIVWEDETYRDGITWSGASVTIQRPGLYLVTVNTNVSNQENGSQFGVWVELNDVTVAAQSSELNSGVFAYKAVACASVIECAAGDVLQVQVRTNSTGGLNLQSSTSDGNTGTRFEVTELP